MKTIFLFDDFATLSSEYHTNSNLINPILMLLAFGVSLYLFYYYNLGNKKNTSKTVIPEDVCVINPQTEEANYDIVVTEIMHTASGSIDLFRFKGYVYGDDPNTIRTFKFGYRFMLPLDIKKGDFIQCKNKNVWDILPNPGVDY